MQEEEAREQVRRLAADWFYQRATASEAAQQADALQRIIAGYLQVFPHLQEEVDKVTSGQEAPLLRSDAPRGAEAVRLVLQETPDEVWLVSELLAELRRRDWLPDSENPANAI